MMVAVREVPVKVLEKNLYYAGHLASLPSVSHHATNLPTHFLLVQNSVRVSQSSTSQDLRSCLLRCMVVFPSLGFAFPCLFCTKQFSCLLLLGSSSGLNLLRHVMDALENESNLDFQNIVHNTSPQSLFHLISRGNISMQYHSNQNG